MSERTAIEWCDSTFNPWVGCTKVSPACDHCYAEGWSRRSGQVEWGNHDRRRTSVQNWNLPLRWQREAEAFERQHGHRRRVFCASLADVFDNQVPVEWRHDLWSMIERCWGMDWLLLTKRPQNIGKMLPDTPTWDKIRGHVWLGTTVEDQERADRNIPHLLKHDAAIRFVSIEPMLGPMDIGRYLHDSDCAGWVADGLCVCSEPREIGIDWVIAGGESGAGARPSHPAWFRSLRGQCTTAGVPFLFKQWGEWDADALLYTTPEGICPPPNMRVGKKAAGRLLDGVEHNGFPT